MKTLNAICAALLISIVFPFCTTAGEPDLGLHGWGEVHFRDSSLSGDDGDEEYKLKAFLLQSRTERWGWFAFGEAKQTYAQGYAGLTYSPAKWLQAGLGLGFEQDKNPLRIGGFLWIGKGRYSLLLVEENGGSGNWYRAEANIQILESVGIGGMAQKNYGAGPRLQFQPPKTKVVIWVAQLYEDPGPGKPEIHSVHGAARLKF